MSADATPAPAAARTAGHIRLTSHTGGLDAPPIVWGAATAAQRGPVIACRAICSGVFMTLLLLSHGETMR